MGGYPVGCPLEVNPVERNVLGRSATNTITFSDSGRAVASSLRCLQGARKACSAAQRHSVQRVDDVRPAVVVRIAVWSDEVLLAAERQVHVLIGLGDVDDHERGVLDERRRIRVRLRDPVLEALEPVAARAPRDARTSGSREAPHHGLAGAG
jgi:hypothetical protein